MKLAKPVREELERCGLPWSIEDGHGHNKIMICGRLAGVCPKTPREDDGRAMLNVRSQIRRLVRQLRSAPAHA